MKIAVLQMNPRVGALAFNAKTIIESAVSAQKSGVEILLTPQMALSGFPLGNLCYQQQFEKQLQEALQQLKTVRNITLLIGAPAIIDSKIFNAVYVLRDGEVLACHLKQYISDKSLFNENRDFTIVNKTTTFDINGTRLGILIAEEIEQIDLIENIKKENANAILCLDSMPYYLHSNDEKIDAIRKIANGLPLLLSNAVGGQDDLVFAGTSFALNAQGEVTWRAPFCKEGLFELDWNQQSFSGRLSTLPEKVEEELYTVLVMALRDYVTKCGFKSVCLGLSGGLDSALVLAIAADAIGAKNCEVFLMPSQYTAELSNSAAIKMADGLGVKYTTIPISEIFDTFNKSLSQRFEGLPEDVTEENLQARIRGTLLMALSNKTGALLLTTGNKSEVAMGYATLYGDMNGGFAPIKDIFKTQAYAISRWINERAGREIIPVEIIERAPSAELRFNQTDQDSLPEYEVLDAMLSELMEHNASAEQLVSMGFNQDEVAKTVKLLRQAEYKRRQGAIGPKVSRCAFGVDWHQQICQQFKDTLT